MRHALLAIALCLLCGSDLRAQRVDLPIGMAPWEYGLVPAYRDSRATGARGITQPPDFMPRTMGEWEEIQGLVVTWASFPSILKQIVRHAKEECEVIIVCNDPASVTGYLQGNQAGGPLPDLANITLLQGGFNSIWARDYMAETIYRNEVDSLYLLDWIYNRPRPLDDGVSDLVGDHLDIPVYATTQAPYDLVHTGGNFMADGFGTAFSSNLVLDEKGPNGQFNQTVKTPAEVDAIMGQWMGIAQGRYVKMPTLPYDGIHHIDMHMKLLDEERLLVGEFPVGVSDGPQLESNLSGVVAGYNSVFGTPYELIRVPMVPATNGNYPPQGSYRTFSNLVFVNGTVLVPTYREEVDTTGLRIIREALPGYKVVGIDCDNNGSNIIAQSGAIHCITKGIGTGDPLLIRHQPLPDVFADGGSDPYPVSAYIRHRSGIASADLYWTTDTADGFNAVEMVPVGGNDWSASIPAQMAGTTVYYYVHATANSGKQQVRPIVAPRGWWRFHVMGISTGTAEAAPIIAEVFPNPVSQVAVIGLQWPQGSPVQVVLRDALGRVALKLHDGALPSDSRLFVDVRGLTPGVYLIDATTANGRATQRLVVK